MHKYGYSIKQILYFTFPLILASLSLNLMFTIDRVILAYYSIDSMNAATLGGNFVATISFLIISIAQIATVFVSQYNGIGEYKKTGHPVWQMVYFCLFSFCIFIPLALATDWLNFFPECYLEEGVKYQRMLMAFAGIQAISVALASFFIGREQSGVVICAFTTGVFANIILDYIFIFGVKGYLQPMGAEGAAIATALVETLIMAIFLAVFLSKKNRETFNTGDYKFRKALFIECIKIGLPFSLGKALNLFGWFTLLTIFSYTSKDLATIESIAMSIWFTFIFFANGASQSICALSGNLIGRNNLDAIKELLKLFLKFNFFICAVFAIPLVFCQDILFLFIDGANGALSHLRSEFNFVFIALWIITLTDGILYLAAGVLTSGGDAKFPIFCESVSLWLFVILPTYILYLTGNLHSIKIPYILITISTTLSTLLVYMRYKKFHWFKQIV